MLLALLVLAGLLIVVGARASAEKLIKAIAGLVLVVTFAPGAATWFAQDPGVRFALGALVTLLALAAGLFVAAKLLGSHPPRRESSQPGRRERTRLVEPEPLEEPPPTRLPGTRGDDLGLFEGGSHEGS